MGKKRILVVDDHEPLLMAIRGILEGEEGYTIFTALDGIQALEIMEQANPDLIIADIMMPRMDGYELLQHLRAEPETMDVPVIILTGMKTPESEVKSLELGGDDYLTKPIKREILIARVKKVLAQKGKVPQSKPDKSKIHKEIDPVDFKLI